MIRNLTGACLALIVVFTALPSGAAEKPFYHPDVAQDATRLQASLKKLWNPAGKAVSVWRKLADQAMKAGDNRQAAQDFGATLALEPQDAKSWLGLAKSLEATEPVNDQEKTSFNEYASGAAFSAYQLGQADALKADALAVLAEVLKRRELWRPALGAFKSSLALVDDKSVHDAYDTLRSQQGFRITDYSVDSDAVTPRLCVQFSDPLVLGQLDYSKFVAVNGADPAAVTKEDYQLCVDGLAHGQRYEVQLRAGLPSSVGEDLGKTSTLAIYVRDRSPMARFTGKNYVLPNKGQQGIPVVSVNTAMVNIEVFKIGDRSLARTIIDESLTSQLSGNQLDEIRDKSGAALWKGDLQVKQELNQEVSTAFPVNQMIPNLGPGVYVMSAVAEGSKLESWKSQATQWFIVSDLGLAAFTGADGVHAFIRSLATAAPKDGTKVKLVARNNEVLGQGTTDAKGYAHFDAGLTRGEGGQAPALLIAETADNDYAFLDMNGGAFDLSDRGVAGRDAPGPLDAFLWAERGVYRPGEQVHLTGLLRDRKANATENLPLTLKIVRPDGVEQQSVVLKDDGLGGRSFTLGLPPTAMTGTWRGRVFADPKSAAIGETSFLVEDYVPERLDMTLTPAAAAFEPGKDGIIKADGHYLYGPPAANLSIEADVFVATAAQGLAGFQGYRFGMDDEKVNPVRVTLNSLGKTDAKGHADVAIALPQLPRTSHLLEAKISLRLREPSGRTIERAVTLPILPGAAAIGIKPQSDKVLERGGVANFDLILLGADGKPATAKGITWQVKKVDRQFQWYGKNGSWSYEPVVYTSKVLDGSIDLDAAAPAKLSVPVQWGEYVLQAASADQGIAATSTTFYAGWYGTEKADSPEVLQIGTDRPSYKVGDTLKLSIAPDGEGKGMVAVLRDGLVSMQQFDVPKSGTSVDIKVEEAMAPGAYVAAILYRPMDEAAKRMPSRSIGVHWVPVDSASRTLGVSLALPDKTPSGDHLKVPVKLTGLAPGEEARVVVAAVDIGILNLTGYKTPSPETWFYGQRRLGVDIRDLYGKLIDGMHAERGLARSGGDGGGLDTAVSLPTVAPVALFSGILKVGADGTAQAAFDIPDFNGALRVMAVAWTKTKLGHADKELIVRDPVALLVSGPRFLTLGDKSQLIFDVHNVEGAAGTYHVAVEQTQGSTKSMALDQDVVLAVGERTLQVAALATPQVGKISYAVTLSGPGNIAVRRNFGLEVHAPAGDVKRTTVQTLAAKSGKITISGDVLKDLIPERSKVTLAVGPAASLDVPGLLAALDRYPYGCAEQTTSRALPLLYLNQVAAAAGITGESEAKKRIEEAITRLFEMQDSSGAFGLWGPSNGDLWLSAYVTDFLSRAKEQGFAVPPRAFTQALDKLQNSVSYASDFEKGGESIAYALYVLARNGRAPIGDLRYYADTRLDRFANPMAKAQIAAALALLGDNDRAGKAFDAAIADVEKAEAAGDSRSDYGSGLRDGAATLTLVSETGVRKQSAARLAQLVSTSRLAHAYTSTQEQSWMLLAARGLIEQGKALALTVNGTAQTGALMQALSADDLAKGQYVVGNSSDTDVQAVVTVSGESLTPEPPAAQGFKLDRSYFTLEGKPVAAVKGLTTLKQNDRVVVVLKLTPTDGKAGRVLLVDRMGAGFEVENPHLVENGNTGNLPWLKGLGHAEHTEFRDDRFVAALNLNAGGQQSADNNAAPADGSDNPEAANTTEGALAAGKTSSPDDGSVSLAYVVRAVTPGDYLLPAATIEDMYAPGRFARTDAGKLKVEAQ